MRGTDFLELTKQHAQNQASQFMSASTGYITSFDRTAWAAKVMLEPSGIETGWLPMPTTYAGSGFGFVGDIDDQTECSVIFESGNPNNGKIVCLHFEDDTPPTIGPGEAVFVHKSGSTLRFLANGNVEVNPAGILALAGGGPALARVGDSTSCPAGHGTITSGSSKVTSG
jgi:phage baseplate assembly protein gpV